MDKYNLLGELIYIIINHYKVHFYLGHWFRGKRNRFIYEMQICSKLIDGLSMNISIDDINKAISCINNYKVYKAANYLRQDIISTSTEHPIINKMMKSIILDIVSLSKLHFNKNKIDILTLIRALQNLPKIYINNASTYYNITILPLNEEDAIEYATSILGKKSGQYINN